MPLMHIIKKNGFFLVEGTRGQSYKVISEIPSCDCPHFSFRLKRIGEKCKHIIAVEEYIKSLGRKEEPYKNKKEDIDKIQKKSGSKLNAHEMQNEANHSIGSRKNKGNENNVYSKIIEFIRANGPIDSILLMEKFGEEEVNFLIFRGDLYEEKGKIKLLE